MQKTTDQLVPGDVVLNQGMRILIGDPIPTYREGVFAFDGLVLNADELCDKDSPEYDNYIACHLRGQWWEDRDPRGIGNPEDRDKWTVQGSHRARWSTGQPWREDGTLFEDAGQPGAEVQVGRAVSRRFRHTRLGGRLYEVIAYPVERVEGEDSHTVIGVEWQSTMTVCTDTEDPGSTEVWSEPEYSDLPERYDGTFSTVELAEAAALQLIRTFDPEHIGWDGAPEMGPPSVLKYGDGLVTFSTSQSTVGYLPAYVRDLVERNNALTSSTQMDYDFETTEGPDGKAWTMAWMTEKATGWVIVCWWAPGDAS